MEIFGTRQFDKWLKGLRDRQARARINARLRTIATAGALTGDVKAVGDGVLELRFHLGPGYRIYVMQEGDRLPLLLIGCDKRTQSRDIAQAKSLAEEWKNEH
ncbi:type II toxin-antitoxin system RelE/ParE family toxin [Actinomycetaceae bacterium L2_0104]